MNYPSYEFLKDPDTGQVMLHDYQKLAHEFIVNNPYVSLMLDMGLGKTLTTLTALYDINPKSHVLIIAPKTIARSTWLDEIAKWKFPFRTKSLIVDEKGRGLTKQKRLALYESIKDLHPSLCFINRELIPDLVDYFQKDWPFSTVIIDEAQSFKSHTSKRFKALKKVRPKIERLVELTGTPTPNGLMDLWAQIYLLDMGTRLGATITEYRQSYFYPSMIIDNHPVKWELYEGSEHAIHSRIKDIAMSIKNTNLKLPPCTFNDVYVYMSPKEKTLYKTMKKEAVLEIGGEDVIAQNAAVLNLKLMQMASGALYIDQEGNYVTIHKEKLAYAAYICKNSSTPVLIAYHFKSDKELLHEYLIKEGINVQIFDGSPEMIHNWNDDKIEVMLIQPASAGHGINLQNGSGQTLVWYTLPTSLEEYLQCNARLYRQGQKNPVVIHHILTKDTIDRLNLKRLYDKDTSQKSLLEAVQAVVRED